jgi:hypothetical protein
VPIAAIRDLEKKRSGAARNFQRMIRFSRVAGSGPPSRNTSWLRHTHHWQENINAIAETAAWNGRH